MSKRLTEVGLERLAEIIKRARDSRSYREFEKVTGVSHATIRRIENGEVKKPDFETLEKLAPHSPYTPQELQAIAQGKFQVDKVRKYLVAEDVLPMTNELPAAEAARLVQLIVGRLAEQYSHCTCLQEGKPLADR